MPAFLRAFHSVAAPLLALLHPLDEDDLTRRKVAGRLTPRRAARRATAGGYLALETHEQKDERLEVKEGAGLILSRRAADQPLRVEALAPGDQFHFEPGMEHCIIGTENLLVFERSVDPKDMDQDLVLIYEPDAAPTQ
jgi:hypothetical protein